MTWTEPQIPPEVTEQWPENTVASQFSWQPGTILLLATQANIQEKHWLSGEGKRIDEGNGCEGPVFLKK